MADYEIDERVDITDVVCPITFVKAKVAMEELEIGQVLAVTMNDGEPVQNVPRSFKEEGQQILKLIDNENGTYDLIVRRLRSRDMAVRINKDNFQAEVLDSTLPVVVEFYSDSCIPCKQLAPILGDIEDDYEEQLKVLKVNVNFDAELAEQYSVMASPTILFFKGGEEVNRIRGLAKKPQLEEAVKELL